MGPHANPAEKALETLIDRLHERGRLRVWSLVVTVFGDAVVPRGGRAPLAMMQEVMARLRVEPGALRTAMSRLAADNWVVRERQGRNSFFHLDERGRHAFDLATRRIYAPGPPAWDGGWTVAIAAPGASANAGAELLGRGFIRIANGVYLRPQTAGGDVAEETLADLLVIHGSSAEHPEMLRELWPSGDVAAAYSALTGAWSPLARALEKTALPAPVDAMAARTLLIHDWRRIVLRDPGLPAALLPRDWPGEDARKLVRGIYSRLAPASESWLDESGLPSLEDAAAFAGRFGGLDTDQFTVSRNR